MEELSLFIGIGAVIIVITPIIMLFLYISTALNVSKIAKIQEENNKMIFEILKLLSNQRF